MRRTAFQRRPVAHISHSLIDGDPANADWTGGEATPVALGNLSATSTRAHVDGLIDKWFLGTDLPSIDSAGKIEATYELQKGPLFSAHEAPSYHDVNQGALGDCWFLASLGEVALQDPSAIRSMITNNHNGTFGVRFFVDGTADYVTVNKELPIVDDRSEWSNGSSLVFANGAKGQPLWAELVEKAFAQLNAEPDAVHGGNGGALNAYEASRVANRTLPSPKSPIRTASSTPPTAWFQTQQELARPLTRAMKLSSPPVITPGPTTSISGATMLMKSSAMMRAMTNSQFTIPGVRHNRSR